MNIPFGYCHCGCGEMTRISPNNDRHKGWVKGQPRRFIGNHSITHALACKVAEAVGNRRVEPHGYVSVLRAPGDRVYEHVAVAEEVLGRPLRFISKGHPDNEVVHHVDANKQNNVRHNLLICTHSYHTSLHHRLEASAAWPEFPPIVRNLKTIEVSE